MSSKKVLMKKWLKDLCHMILESRYGGCVPEGGGTVKIDVEIHKKDGKQPIGHIIYGTEKEELEKLE